MIDILSQCLKLDAYNVKVLRYLRIWIRLLVDDRIDWYFSSRFHFRYLLYNLFSDFNFKRTEYECIMTSLKIIQNIK